MIIWVDVSLYYIILSTAHFLLACDSQRGEMSDDVGVLGAEDEEEGAIMSVSGSSMKAQIEHCAIVD